MRITTLRWESEPGVHEIKRYALSSRLEQQVVFFCLLQSEAMPVFFRQPITDVRRLEKTALEKNGPRRPTI
jgi:hypothetical protein